MFDHADQVGVLAVTDPLDAARAVVPVETILDGETLLWRRGDLWEPGDPIADYLLRGFRRGGSVDGALWAFLDLWDAKGEDVAAFVRRYGAFGIRPDGKPSSAPIVGTASDLPPMVERDDVEWFVEPTAAYRGHAVALRALLAFSIAARGDDPLDGPAVLTAYGLDRFEWDAFGLAETYDDHGAVTGLYRQWLQNLNPRVLSDALDGRSSMEARAILGHRISLTWLAWASLTPVLTWSAEPRLTLGFGDTRLRVLPAGGAFSVIVGQALAVLQSDGFERLDQCAVCGKLFEPAIKPGRHTVAYCPDHKLEGGRARKRKWARRKAQERRDSDSREM